MTFCLLEPVTLGFLPFHTQEGSLGISANRTNLSVTGMGYGIPVDNLTGLQLGDGGVGQISDIDEILHANVKVLGTESMVVHRTCTSSLRTLSNCRHGQRAPLGWACKQCMDGLGTNYKIVVLQNGVLRKYVRDVMCHGHLDAVFTRTNADTMVGLIYRSPRAPPVKITFQVVYKDASVICSLLEGVWTLLG